MPEDKTPPTGTRIDPRPAANILPTVPAVYNLTAGVAGQVEGLRGDVDEVLTRLGKLLLHLEPPSEPPPPQVLELPDASGAAEPAARPSIPARAAAAVATGTSRTGGWALKISGGLMIIAQLISWASRPENGPVVQSLRIIAAAVARQPAPPPSELPAPEWTPLYPEGSP